MSLTYEPNRRYRMPIGFGPSVSPRAVPPGIDRATQQGRITTAGVSIRTDADRIEEMLPPKFTLEGAPILNVEFSYLSNLGWLGGGSYALVSVNVLTRYHGTRDKVVGQHSLVLWENRTDCCLTGREELGAPKIFGDVPPPAVLNGRHTYKAYADGKEFLRIDLSNLADGPIPPMPSHDGTLFYRYVPKVGAPGEAEVEHAVLTPHLPGEQKIARFQTAEARIAFFATTFEQAPTQFMIINQLASLPIHEVASGRVVDIQGSRTYDNARAIY